MNEWQARVEMPDSSRRGSGFLVTERHVLTCAHVVRDSAEAWVTLGGGAGPYRAAVLDRGPWWSATARTVGDVAVLELESPAEVTPARFAPFTATEIYAGQPLTAHGYPQDYAKSGVNTTFTADAAYRIGSDLQITGTDQFGVRIQEGFSGAAACAVTGEVVGMIKAASLGVEERIGLMTPVSELVRHCPRLDDLISLGPLNPAAYRELREMLRRIEVTPEYVSQLLTTVRGKLPGMPRRLTSLLAIAESLVVETFTRGEDEVRAQLAGLLVRLRSREMLPWVSVHLFDGGPPPPVPETPAHEGTVVVQLEPTAAAATEAYDLRVWTVTEPDGELTEEVDTATTLGHDEWRERIERALPAAFARFPVTVETVTVEFVLPRDFLSEPVDEWIDRADDDLLLGVSRPVVVRDLDWFVNQSPAELLRRLRTLRQPPRPLGELLRWRDCRTPPGSAMAFKAWLRGGDPPAALAMVGDWAVPERIAHAVASGLPVLLWWRSPCGPDAHAGGADCPGDRFRREMAGRLQDATYDMVAQRVRELRADSVTDDDDQRCGGITLLREDARRRPMPLSFAE